MNRPVFANIYGQAYENEAELSPTEGQTWGSAFRLENDLVNVFEWMNRPSHTVDPNFDYRKKFDSLNLPIEMLPNMASSLNDQDFDEKLARVQQEEMDKAIIASSGWTGTVAAMGAGALSPTMFIPFVGQGRGALAFGQVVGLAAAGATAQEAALYYTQETRTEAEVFTGIAMNTLLGGMLGGAWLGLTKSGRARLSADVELGQKSINVPKGDMDSGRATTERVQVEPPTQRDFDVMTRMPDTKGRDKAATNSARVEPFVPSSVRRVYYTGAPSEGTTSVRASTSREGAATANSNEPLYYLDVPVSDPRFARAENAGLDAPDPEVFGDLLPEELPRSVEIYRGADPASPAMARMRKDIDAEVDELVRASNGVDEPYQLGNASPGQSVGAATVRARNTRGLQQAPNRVRQALLNTAGQVSPQFRMATNKAFASLRHAIMKLDNSGMRQAGLDELEPSADGGAVIERIRVHDYNIVKFTQALDKSYYKHLYPGVEAPPNAVQIAVAQIKSRFDLVPEGKLTWEEFNANVYDGLTTGQVELPEVGSAVSALKDFFNYYNSMHKEYLAELGTRGLDAAPLYKELTESDFGQGALQYAHQIYDPVKIKENISEFLQEHSDFFRQQLEADYARDFARFNKRRADIQFQRDFTELSPTDKSNALAEVESGIEFLDETPELEAYSNARADLRQQARDEEWTPEQLKLHTKELTDNLNEGTQELLLERADLLRTARNMRKLGGDASAKVMKLQEALDKTNGLIERMFRDGISRIKSSDLEIGKLQAKGDGALVKVEGQLKKALSALSGRQAAYAKLLESARPNMKSRSRVMEQIEAKKLKYDQMLQRLDDVHGQGIALAERLREVNLIREEAVRDATSLARARAERAADIEGKLEAAEAKILSPEEQQAAMAELNAREDTLVADFSDKWRAKGERSGDPEMGQPDFAEAALEEATYFEQKLTGADVQPAYFTARQDVRGPQLERMLKLPYDLKKKWLVRNTETVARAYDRQMGPDLEIWRAFDGRVNGQNVLDEMSQEAADAKMRVATSKYVKLPAGWIDRSAKFAQRVKDRVATAGEGDDLYLSSNSFSNEAKEGYVPLSSSLRNQIVQNIDDELAHQSENFNVAITRLRNTRMVPKDANAIGWRIGKSMKDLNVLTMMGSVLVSSVADIARPVYQHGVSRTLSKGWAPFISNLKAQSGKSYRLASKELNHRIGLTLEPMLHSRAQGILDMMDPHLGGKSKLERGISFLANKTGLVAGFDYWTAGMKSVSAAVTHSTLAVYIPTVAEALAKGKVAGEAESMLSYLRGLGFRDLDIQRIAGEMSKPRGMEVFSNGSKLPNIEAWEDMAAYRAYGAAVQGEVNKLIVTPGLERPNWTDENMAYSMLAQFRSFTFASNSRMMMSGLQGNDPYLMQGIAASLAFGALSYYAYAVSVGGDTLTRAHEAELEDWVYEAVDRSGLLGVLSLGQRIGEQFPVTNQFAAFGGEDKPFRRPSGVLGTIFGPSVGQMEKASEFLLNMDGDTEGQKTLARKRLRQLFVPYQNHFVLRQFFDRVGDAIQDTLGG